MIDLSFLTEEEHGVIMTVLRRDAQLKQAEEQRIRKLESILSQGSSSDSKLKYLTGQWFYEAKSRRHMDKIHGSEIILASMKQRSASEGSYRSERLRAASSPSCDVEAPQKPARCLDMPLELNCAKKDDMTSAVHSPRMTRHNPFNRPSLIVVEPAERLSETGEQKLFSYTNPNAMFPNGISPSLEATSPLMRQQHGGSSQTSGTSMTSEGSSAGFRPIPKKRTCISKRTSSVSGSSGTAPDLRLVSVGFLPALRRSLNQGSNGSSTRSMGEVAGSTHSSASIEIPQQLLCDGSQVLSHSSLEGGRKPSLVTADRGDALLDGDTAQMIEDSSTHRERLTVGRMQDSDPVIGSSVISSVKEPEWRRTAGKNDDEEENPVRKALRRAEARPKGLAKSMEDLAGSLSPRQERRQKPKTDMRQIGDGPTALPPSRLFLGQAHLKKMSKSVPSFLQREDDSPIYEDIFHPMDSSFDLASVSSFSGSVMTMESGDFGSVDVQGSIQFSINYVQKLREFHIFVAQCRDLAAADPKRGRSDPYVKSYLVPDKIHLGKKKTSVKKKTLNPTFNEILRYRVSSEYLRTQTLVLSVWHHDTFGRNNFLGEVDTDLSKWDFDHTHMNDLPLRARTRRTLTPSSGRGEMRVAVRFLPKVIHSEANDAPITGEIHIWVKECKSLPLIRATIDPYVKCFVLPDTSRKSRQKTRVLRRTADPVFNHTMVYDGIREMDLAEACVELSVWDRDKLASSLLGGLRLGAGTGRSYGSAVDWMDSTPEEVALWARMAASPNEWAEAVLPLRMMSSAKTAFR
ncbi:synaptotagmin-like protein 2 isoform X5 [Hippocampus comes]|uniref:synaptotagmin-like protein 2 isoform X5 n=1 Tax=Hippocampus comes TaxID=109280 RepID=UPI00094E3DA4|nr:PREDICTED: synaptotagmin-like protein 2 isoform X5 [Hippocampus comes]